MWRMVLVETGNVTLAIELEIGGRCSRDWPATRPMQVIVERETAAQANQR